MKSIEVTVRNAKHLSTFAESSQKGPYWLVVNAERDQQDNTAQKLSLAQLFAVFPNTAGICISERFVDLEALEGNSRITMLGISGVRNGEKLDLNRIPNLKELDVSCKFFSKQTLEQEGALPSTLRYLKLWAGNVFTKDFGWVKHCPKLTELSVYSQTTTSFSGIEQLRALKTLRVSLRSLEQFKELKALEATLETLTIDATRHANDYAVLGYLSHLELLEITNYGSVGDLRFLLKLRKLHTLLISGLDVSDGKISRLLQLRKLRYVAITSKRHFDMSFDELNAILSARPPS